MTELTGFLEVLDVKLKNKKEVKDNQVFGLSNR